MHKKKTPTRPSAKSPWPKIATGVVAFALFITGFAHFLQTRPSYRLDVMLRVQERYAQEHDRADQWFIDEVPKGSLIETTGDIVWKRGEEIRKSLTDCARVSAETARVWDLFQDFATTFQLNTGVPPDRSLLQTMGRITSADKKGLERHHEISFLPRQVAQTHVAQGRSLVMLAWRGDMGISIGAIEWPEKFLAGALYHELYHGSLHPVNYRDPGKGYHEHGSLEYAIEEIRAHAIEADVLDFKSGGGYFRKLDEIIGRGILRRKTEDIVAFVTTGDLMELDRMFGIDTTGAFVASFAYSQYVYALAIRHMDKLGKSEADKAEFYRALVRLGVMS